MTKRINSCLKQKLQKWLSIPTTKDLEDVSKEMVAKHRAELASQIQLWTQTVKSIGEIKCSHCAKTIVTYPYGGGYYREADGTVLCSSECLGKRLLSKPEVK